MTYSTLQELFADPARWTQGYYARNSSGESVGWSSPDAVCYCLEGGCFNVTRSMAEALKLIDKLGAAIVRRADHNGIADFNDDPRTTHADVLALVTRENV